MAMTVDQFTRRLTDSGILTVEDVRAFVDSLDPAQKPTDPQQLARLLVKAKKLTAYQAQTIYAGQGGALVLGNYVVLDKLGEGGMGMVLKARHKRMERVVALKVLSPKVTKDEGAVQRFRREAVAAARLMHPNIVTAYDADEAKGTHFLVMEYVEGKDLSAVVKETGRLSVAQAVKCILQAARGLEFAHRQGVIHRDIKPSNLLLDASGSVKILDMGLARVDVGGAQQAELTASGAVMGTVDYMSPEQAEDTKRADARSDIYSLGISLWYLLTGRAAYERESLMAKLIAHRESPPPNLADARADVSQSLVAAFEKMVAKRPEDRFQTMSDVIAALESSTAGGASSSSLVAPAADPEDAKFSLFLRGQQFDALPDAGLRPAAQAVGLASGPRTQVSPEATIITAGSEVDTDPKSFTSASLGGLTSTPWDAKSRPAVAKARPTAKLDPKLLGLIAVGCTLTIGAVLLILGVIVLWPSSKGTVSIEVNDPQLEVKVDKDGARIKGPGKQNVKLKIGQHGLTVKHGKLEFHTDKFELKKGDVVTLKVELLPDKVQVSHNGKVLGSKELPKPAVVGPIDKAPGTPSVGTDVERKFAQWLLDRGVPCEVTVVGKTIRVEPKTPLPTESFFVTSIAHPLPGKLNPSDLEEGLRQLRALKRFSGGYLPLVESDRWAEAFAEHPSVSAVNAYAGDITGKGLVSLTRLKGCKYLNLDGCSGVTSQGLLALSAAKSLETLELDGTAVAAGKYALADLQKLQNALPDCRIQQAGGKKIEGLKPAEVALAGPAGTIAALLTSPDYEWTKPENLGPVVNGDFFDEHPELSPDGLMLWFSGGGELWTCSRENLDSPFAKRVNAGRIINDVASWESEPALSSDGLTLIFCSGRGPVKNELNLWMCSRSKTSEPFGEVAKLGGDVNSPAWDICPALSPDGLTLVFTSGRPGGVGDLDLWQATRASPTEEFGNVKNLGPKVNRPARDSSPHLSSDGLVLLFESSRSVGEGKNDLFLCTRSSRDDRFDKPMSLGTVINTPDEEQGPCLSSDGKTLMFYSDRPGGQGKADLWMSRRVPVAK